MTTVLILNIVLAIVVLAAILSFLGWGIATDRAVAASLSGSARNPGALKGSPSRPHGIEAPHRPAGVSEPGRLRSLRVSPSCFRWASGPSPG
jgi:hypothetical protein